MINHVIITMKLSLMISVISVARQREEVEKMRQQVEESRIEHDSVIQQLSTNAKVLCDLERSISSLFARLSTVCPSMHICYHHYRCQHIA